jgi:glutaredoxin
MLYALSTCVWCKRTRQFLEDQDVEFDYIYVDLLQGEERREVAAQVRKWNPSASFPTVVIDDEKCIIGYNKDQIRELLGL